MLFRMSDFELKLMEIETEHLGIPDTEYKCTVRMPAAEFQRIIRDLQVLGDACKSWQIFFCFHLFKMLSILYLMTNVVICFLSLFLSL